MQKGFIQLSLTGYIYLGFTVAMLITLAMLKVQTLRLESCKAEHAAFVANVERLGLEAKEIARAHV